MAETEPIQLPGKYFLTGPGLTYCRKRQIPLRELSKRRGDRGSGFVWKTFHPINVQRFVAYELLEEIEIERPEFLTKRREIMTMTRFTVTGILFKRFRPELKQLIRQSKLFTKIEQHSREVGRAHILAFVKRNERAIRAIRHSLMFEPEQSIQQDASLNERERTQRLQEIRSIVDAIDDEVWFLLALLSDADHRQNLVQTIQDLLIRYVQRFRVADYVSLILMELLQYAETTQLHNFAERDRSARLDSGDIVGRLSDPSFREKLFERAARTNSLLGLNYAFIGNPYSNDTPPQVKISVINHGLLGYGSRETILTKRGREVRSVPLAQFYETESPDQFDTTLGTYYLESLQKAVEDAGMHFASDLVRDERREETSTTIVIGM